MNYGCFRAVVYIHHDSAGLMVGKFLLVSFLERKTTHWMTAPVMCEMFGCITDSAASQLTGEDSDQHMINQM